MKVNAANNQTFGQIYCSPQLKEYITKLAKKAGAEFNVEHFAKNWKKCLDTKVSDLYIRDKHSVFVVNKQSGVTSEEDLCRSFLWNVDSALKRIISYELKRMEGYGAEICK